jgi:hypothetical protein
MPNQDTWAYVVLYSGLGLLFIVLVIAIIRGPQPKDIDDQGKPEE